MTKPLRLPQFFGYTAGDAANNLAFSMSSMFVLIYYTDVVGISAAGTHTNRDPAPRSLRAPLRKPTRLLHDDR